MWLPDRARGAPDLLRPDHRDHRGVGNYVVARLLVQGMPTIFPPFAFPLMVVALLTMVYGGAMTMVQNDVKYLFAWSTMSQNAYSLLGIGSLSLLGVSGGIFYFLNHIIGKTHPLLRRGDPDRQVGHQGHEEDGRARGQDAHDRHPVPHRGADTLRRPAHGRVPGGVDTVRRGLLPGGRPGPSGGTSWSRSSGSSPPSSRSPTRSGPSRRMFFGAAPRRARRASRRPRSP